MEDSNENKYLTVVLTYENKDKLKRYEERWGKIRDLIRSKADNLDDYDKKYMEIKFNSDDNLPLNKTLDLCNIIIVI